MSLLARGPRPGFPATSALAAPPGIRAAVLYSLSNLLMAISVGFLKFYLKFLAIFLFSVMHLKKSSGKTPGDLAGLDPAGRGGLEAGIGGLAAYSKQ
jgi:hypothetical protein